MLEPLKDIRSASELLGQALNRYFAVCSTIESQTHSIPKSLSHLIDKELLTLDSYELKIRQARSSLGRAKNHNLALVPINSLPSEVLSRIFRLVLNASRRISDQPESIAQKGSTRYPDTFLHVCSRWRQIAAKTCTLWSRIDIIPHDIYAAGLPSLTRAQAFEALAGQSPLDLRITGTPKYDWSESYLPDSDIPLFQFFSAVAPRIQSLELDTSSIFSRFHFSVLQAFCVNCTPGTLTRLVVQMPCGESQLSCVGFLVAREHASRPNSLPITMQQEQLEAFLHPIKVLRLCGIYLDWSSRAYHGLVELQLLALGSSMPMTMTEAQFVGILAASPQLRILHFGMNIQEPLPKHASITPVHLDNLEVLDLSFLWHLEQNGTILRWIATGSKPPIVALRFEFPEVDLSDNDIKQFLVRSRPTKVVVSGFDCNVWPPDLLSLSPHLEILVFKSLGYCIPDDPHSFPEEQNTPPASFRPNYLHLILCEGLIDLGWLQQVLERRPIHTITLYRIGAFHSQQQISSQGVEQELLKLCPIVRVIGRNEQSPIMDWNLLG